jgi:hypothetical protein
VAVIMLVGMAPAPVFAQDATGAMDATVAVPPPDNGPTGSSAHTYHYNSTSGLWENDYYTYDPATHITTPIIPLEYTCNPDTHKWDTTIWDYIASHDVYEQENISLNEPPAGAVTHDCPVVETTIADTLTGGQDGLGQQSTQNTEQTSPTNTDPDSNTQSSTNGVTLNTNITSNSTSGNALAMNNDDVGNVGTGNALAVANVINMLQSQASFAAGGLNTFTANIQGNVQGDFIIDPTSLTQPATVNPNDLNKAKITSVNNGTINNNIVLNAMSGNATADNNDDVLGVGTGDATAIVDVVNMINSVVAANQSFLGVINIYGDYSGNILMPVDSLNALLATGGTNSNMASADNSVTSNDNYNINNNVNLGASSGVATASNNDDVGSVTTGNAMTNLTILNLTGKQVVASNSLLVFVNVLGHWVGLIMDAPAGTTSAALGGGVASNATLASAQDVNSANNYAINNNIIANAKTGDATATNNDDVGSVATGNALAGVNLANLINSNFSLSNWFGVLFINVFGNWHGNFGVMKPPVIAPITSGSALGGQGGGDMIHEAKVFAFVPTGSSTSSEGFKLSPVTTTGSQTPGSHGGGNNTLLAKANAVLGASHGALKPHADVRASLAGGFNYWTVLLMGVGSAGLGFVAFERVRSNLRGRYITKI